MIDIKMLDEMRSVIQELLTQEFVGIRASLDQMEKMIDRNHLATVARLDRLAASLRADFAALSRSSPGGVTDARFLERLSAIERELACWRRAGS